MPPPPLVCYAPEIYLQLGRDSDPILPSLKMESAPHEKNPRHWHASASNCRISELGYILSNFLFMGQEVIKSYFLGSKAISDIRGLSRIFFFRGRNILYRILDKFKGGICPPVFDSSEAYALYTLRLKTHLFPFICPRNAVQTRIYFFIIW